MFLLVPGDVAPTNATQAMGPAGWLALLAAAIFVFLRLLKSNRVDAVLAKLSIPPIPKKAIPWLALALGFAAQVVNARIGGYHWTDAAQAGFWGILSGTVSIGGQETLPSLFRGVLGERAASFLFGPNAGPDPGPAASTPSMRPTGLPSPEGDK